MPFCEIRTSNPFLKEILHAQDAAILIILPMGMWAVGSIPKTRGPCSYDNSTSNDNPQSRSFVAASAQQQNLHP